MMRPAHLLLLLLPICAYLYFRTQTLEARVEGLEDKLSVVATGAPGGAPGSAKSAWAPAAPAPDGDPTGPSTADGAATAAATPAAELRALRKEVASLREEVERARDPDEILDVVQQEEARIRSAHVDFHRERWIELREDTLGALAEEAGFTDFQRDRVGTLMNDEVDRIAELARQPDVFEDPDQLANDVMQILDETDERARSLLNDQQEPIWEKRRKIERDTIYPWLPR